MIAIYTKNKDSFFVFALAVCAIMLCCVGCEKTASRTERKIDFKVYKKYEKGPLTVHIRLDKQQLTIADTFWLEFEAEIEPAYKVRMPVVHELLKDFGIVDWENPPDRLGQNNRIVTTNRYRLEPFLSGDFVLPAFVFEFADVNSPEQKKYELQTEPIDIKVTSLLEKNRSELVIADIDDVVAMPHRGGYLWLWLLLSFLVAAAAVVVLSRRKRRIELVRIFRPAHDIAMENLRKLIEDDLINKGQIKRFYERISDILRHYIEHRFDLKAPEMTTEEFLVALKDSDVLGKADKQALAKFLEHCDLVKFAKYEPAAEQIQQTFNLVKEFIEKTKSDEPKIDVTDSARSTETVIAEVA
jgi:hypothetical protein